jgi:hypothetical protein
MVEIHNSMDECIASIFKVKESDKQEKRKLVSCFAQPSTFKM